MTKDRFTPEATSHYYPMPAAQTEARLLSVRRIVFFRRQVAEDVKVKKTPIGVRKKGQDRR